MIWDLLGTNQPIRDGIYWPHFDLMAKLITPRVIGGRVFTHLLALKYPTFQRGIFWRRRSANGQFDLFAFGESVFGNFPMGIPVEPDH
jgi:hypothetical protein